MEISASSLISVVRAACLLLAGAPALLAQCSMCRTAVAAQEARAIDSLNAAIFILLVPATVLFSGIFIWSFRYRNSDEQ